MFDFLLHELNYLVTRGLFFINKTRVPTSLITDVNAVIFPKFKICNKS